MTRLVLKRLGSGVIMLWILSMAVFALFFIAPNDVAQKIAGRQATPLTVALVSKRLGLNRPSSTSTPALPGTCCTATWATRTTTQSRY